MEDQQQAPPVVQCGRPWDHAEHMWLSREDRWCPGKVSKYPNAEPKVSAWEPKDTAND